MRNELIEIAQDKEFRQEADLTTRVFLTVVDFVIYLVHNVTQSHQLSLDVYSTFVGRRAAPVLVWLNYALVVFVYWGLFTRPLLTVGILVGLPMIVLTLIGLSLRFAPRSS